MRTHPTACMNVAKYIFILFIYFSLLLFNVSNCSSDELAAVCFRCCENCVALVFVAEWCMCACDCVVCCR